MGRFCTTTSVALIFASALGITALGVTASAKAFQEIPAPPQTAGAPAPDSKAPLQAPALALTTSHATPGALSAREGLEIFGYAIMPELDFGLDLLYGQDEEQRQRERGLTSFDVGHDVKVLGKIKRRF
ncbi:MAG TPA: hypothetical protein VMW68_05710 [Methyloceanibacter sp.]|nr:hypothetical protein [Methyloceanibacter sp.]